jgi:hypothetical protein
MKYKMNERIEKLGEQADLLGEFTPTKIPGRYVGYITEEQILKFAELIVAECSMFVVTELEGKVGSRIADATANRLEEHFGVE